MPRVIKLKKITRAMKKAIKEHARSQEVIEALKPRRKRKKNAS